MLAINLAENELILVKTVSRFRKVLAKVNKVVAQDMYHKLPLVEKAIYSVLRLKAYVPMVGII
jgi:hypothetical protein